MAAATASSTMRDGFRASLRQQLCNEYPYLNRDALEAMLDSLEAGLTKEAPATAASMGRSNLLTLPCELRDMIYELVFKLNGAINKIRFTCDEEDGCNARPTRVPQGSLRLLRASKPIWKSISIHIMLDLRSQLDGTFRLSYEDDDDRSRLIKMGQKQCAMIEKLVLEYAYDRPKVCREKVIFPTCQEAFQTLGLDSLGVKVEALELKEYAEDWDDG